VDKHSEQSTDVGPGKTLHQARIDLGLSPEDVASQLHLAARQIVALENDDYKNLPQATYVRGYLRSYSLLLGLAPEPLLEAYTRLQKKSAAAMTKVTPAAEPMLSKDNQVKYITYLMGAIVIGLTAAWWQGHESSPPLPENNPPAANLSAETSSLPTAQDIPPALEKSDQPTPPADKIPGTPGVTKEPLVPRTSSATASAASAQPFPKQQVVPENKPLEQQVVPENKPLAPATPGNRARMVLRAEQDSWVDIRDARQTQLLYETVPAGRVVTVEGITPFNVFLGNADGIKLEFNGKPYDASRHKRGLVARFVLGGANVPNQ